MERKSDNWCCVISNYTGDNFIAEVQVYKIMYVETTASGIETTTDTNKKGIHLECVIKLYQKQRRSFLQVRHPDWEWIDVRGRIDTEFDQFRNQYADVNYSEDVYCENW